VRPAAVIVAVAKAADAIDASGGTTLTHLPPIRSIPFLTSSRTGDQWSG